MARERELYTKSWKASLISVEATLMDALKAISQSGAMMACIVNEMMNLDAILTDSDIRKALLAGARIEDNIKNWINRSPVRAQSHLQTQELVALAIECGVREIPLVDIEGRLVDIFVLAYHQEKLLATDAQTETIENPMLIVAGGLGERLRTIVSDRPKPLAVVGSRPILETLILRSAQQGIRKFFISVNYMAEQIENHLRSSKYNDLDIVVVKETSRLGTAGSLSLIADQIDKPIIVCNADVLSTVSFTQLIEHHHKEHSDLTCCVRPYGVSIPFGVFDIAGNEIVGIQEKPKANFLVNAGIYVISPDVCRFVPRQQTFDMPDLIHSALHRKRRVSPFVMHEYWIDIGHPEDFDKANAEFNIHFKEGKI